MFTINARATSELQLLRFSPKNGLRCPSGEVRQKPVYLPRGTVSECLIPDFVRFVAKRPKRKSKEKYCGSKVINVAFE